MIESILIFVGGIVFGIIVLILVTAKRAVSSDGWDDSNVFNWLRLWMHTILHPEDFAKMKYPDGSNPFPYLSKDEFSENFPDSRPK